MSTKTTLADEFAGIICDRNEALEERYSEVVEAVCDALEADWDGIFGPWIDSIQGRVESKLAAERAADEQTSGVPAKDTPGTCSAANVVLLDARDVTIWRDVDGGFHICVGSPDDFREVVLPMTVMQVLARNLDELIGSGRGS